MKKTTTIAGALAGTVAAILIYRSVQGQGCWLELPESCTSPDYPYFNCVRYNGPDELRAQDAFADVPWEDINIIYVWRDSWISWIPRAEPDTAIGELYKGENLLIRMENRRHRWGYCGGSCVWG